VLGRRPDGYHELESLFLPLDLADEVVLSLAPADRARVDLSLHGEAPGVPGDGDNLAARAAARFLEAAGLERSVSIGLRKRIPAAAGLGGGSSDAAAVLRGLDGLLPGVLGAEALRELAVGLGADVPFFLEARPSLVSGVGERCEPLGVPWPAWTLVLANPGHPLATAAVFRAYDAAGPGPAAPRRPLAELVRQAAGDPGVLPELLENHLEPAALALCPAIAPLRERLREAGALAVGLSGSGATVFGVFAGEAQARAALPRFAPPCWARVARTAEAR
jgi:4-diphosphocytidyl-2-C-methyl-D-erythritol kinase